MNKFLQFYFHATIAKKQRMQRYCLMLLCCLSLCKQGIAQNETYKLQINPTFFGQPLQLIKAYFHPQLNDSVKISVLKFYVGNVKLYHHHKLVAQQKVKYHLIDFTSSPIANILDLPIKNFDSLSFTLGVDSVTNHKAVFKNELDPRKGMYWTWHSGFINIKIEGSCTKLDTRNHAFQYHLGGFESPNNSTQQVGIKLNNNSTVLLLELSTFISNCNLLQNPNIMTPSSTATQLANLFSKGFHL